MNRERIEQLALHAIYRRIDAVLDTPLPKDVAVKLRQILPAGYRHSFHVKRPANDAEA